MRLAINLATQPYEVAREYKRRVSMAIVALGVVAVLLVGYIIYQRGHTRDINRKIAAVQQQIDALGHEESQARAMLNKPANRQIADQSDFLNDLFARKSLSWTRIFSVMERIMPADLHVVSMKPEYTKANDLVIHIVVATDSRDRAVELVRHMEQSNHFRQPQVVAETMVGNTSAQTAGPASNIQFDIAAVYVPVSADSDEGVDSGAKAGEASAGSAPTAAKPVAAPVKAPSNAVPPTGNVRAQNQPGNPALRGH